ncbi:non-ribosomal peptide synthetase [Pseudomonas parafulva]|uniref:non-ribosomal peptide synthetase n=1 Tax=Pseudomonas parafulva TaxID=157782 RepID=UPI001427D25B|nr:non-ribosomal peptide synthetase [Pseudomonas parafulva]
MTQNGFLEIAQRLASLPADKKRLFRQRLAEKGIDSWRLPIVAQPAGEGGGPCLSQAQRRFLAAEALSNRALYNLASVLRFDGRLDLERLRQAMQQLSDRHQILRTRYVADAQGQWQALCTPVAVALPPMSPITAQDTDAWCADEYARQLAEPFDLAQQVPWRWQAFSDAEAGTTWLFLTLHHVAYDAWSAQQLTQELAEAYRALQAGDTAQQPELSIQYADYAAWEQEWLDSDECQRQVDYWRAQLDDAPAPLSLPLDRPRPAPSQRSHAGAVITRVLPDSLTKTLDVAIRRQGVTLYLYGLTAFSWLLARYSGERDFCLGTSVALRDRPELMPLIGPLLNTLVIRQTLQQDADFASALRSTRDRVAGAYDHQCLPFENMLQSLQPPRSSALFQVMFVQVDLPASRTLALPGVGVEVLDPPQRHARFDLTLRLVRSGEGAVRCELEYSEELFDAATVEQMLDDLTALLGQVCEDPAVALGDLRLASPGSELCAPALQAPTQPLDRQVLEHARRTPKAVALHGPHVTLDYATLGGASQALAQRLADSGVAPGAVVALCMSRCPEQVVATLACWHRGAVCLFLDPAQPAQRHQQLVHDSGACLWLSLGEAPPPGSDLASLPLTRADLHSAAAPTAVASLSDPALAAYLIYTSGSSGQPKGVRVSHGNLAHYAAAVVERLQAPPGSRWASLATVAADLGLTSVFAALQAGQTLVLPPPALAFDPPAWADFLDQSPVDCLKIAPSHLRGLLALADAERVLPRERLIVGGEGFDPALLAQVRRLAPGLRVFNHYGPSETTVGVVCGEVDESLHCASSQYLPLGQPLAGCRLRVVDAQGNRVPRGVAGELIIAGPQVALGYLNQPEASAQVFGVDADGERHYRTGDRVRLDRAGLLTFLGRRDEQVKIRGFRVEPGEVTAWLNAQPQVREAAVVPSEDQGRVQLLAYLSPALAAHDLAELQASARAALPEAMIPAHWVLLDALPLTANGKLDRRALPVPAEAERGAGKAPQGETEATLARLWQVLLGVEAVGRGDDFFALGGDSILSLQLIAQARRESLRLKPRDVQQHPVLADLALHLDCQAQPALRAVLEAFREVLAQPALGADDDFHGAGGDSILALQLIARLRRADMRLTPRQLHAHPTPRALAGVLAPSAPVAEAVPVADTPTPASGRYPLSHAQQRVWFMQQLDPQQTAYNVTQLLSLRGPLDVARLQRACEALVTRHEALRCRFFEADGEVWQRLEQSAGLHFKRHALHDLDAAEQQAVIARCAGRAFDLGEGPLLAVDLLCLGPQDYRLLFNVHHIAVDGWSMGLLVKDLAQLYQGQATPAPHGLLPWIAQQRAHLQGEQGDALLAYWQTRLQGLPDEPLQWPQQPQRPTVQDYRGARDSFVVPQALDAALASRAATLGVTPFVLYFAAYQLLLSRHTGSQDFAIGLPVAGRESVEGQHWVGLFVNTLVCRVQLDVQQAVQDFLRQLGDRLADDLEHQSLPFEHLLDVLGVQRSLDRTPVFQTLFNFQVDHDQARRLELADVQVQALPLPEGVVSAKFDLTFNLFSQGRGEQARTQLIVERACALLDAPTVQRLVDDYLGMLEVLAHGELHAPLLELPLRSLAPSPEQGPQRPLLACDDFVSRFEAMAKQQPHAVAVYCADRQLRYDELDAQANRLAHWLLEQDVRPESTVAFCLPRDERLLICLLAIQKAGACYLPLDPTHPPARLTQILERAQPLLVLCDEPLTALTRPERWWRWSALDVQHFAALTPDVPRALAQLAYTLYTSGSTGQPKGVQISRGNFANFLLAMEQALALDGVQRYLALTTVSFDISGLELCLPLVRGAAVVLADDAQRQDPLLLAHLIEHHQVQLIQATPATWRLLLDSAPQVLDGRIALAGGEAVSAELAQALTARVARLHNVYGPTETTVWSTQTLLETLDQASAPIGHALLNTRCHVLDEHLREVPLGAVGELYIAGAGLARGYAGQPGLTAERFIADPFAADGGRLYRTGDLARRQADGQLYFLGRNDDQIKLRGFRIELGEVEAALLAHAQVSQAVVAVQGEHLAGFWVGALEQEGQLREHLLARLPAYMVPTHLQRLAHLPLNSNGKVDRKQLPLAQVSMPSAEASGRALTPREAGLAEVWQQVLGVPVLAAEADFFRLGGHSLNAAQVRARLREQGLDMPLRWLFETPQLAALASRLDTLQAGQSGASAPMTRVDLAQEQVLSSAQQRVWLMQQLEPADSSFNMNSQIRLRGALDVEALRGAIQRVVERHAILRTTYHGRDGEPRQRIAAPQAGVLQCIDSDGQGWEQAALELATRPFDLSQEPSLRAVLYRLAEHEHVLQLVLHHIASDGWSGSVLIGEIVEGYEQACAGRVPALAELPIQYVDYAAWERSSATQARHREGLAFWRRRLSGMPAQVPLPFDFPRAEHSDSRGAAVDFQLPAATVARLNALAQATGTSLFMVLLTCYGAVLHHESHGRDLVIGTDLANREHPDTESLIGFFVNLLALRLALQPERSFREHLLQVRETCLEAFAWQDTPFDQVVECLQLPRIANQHPLLQTLFVLDNTPRQTRRLGELEVEPLLHEQRHSKFDMALFARAEGDVLALRWVYRPSLFRAATIERLRDTFLTLLEQALHAPDSSLEALIPTSTGAVTMSTDNPLQRKMSKLGRMRQGAGAAPRAPIDTRPLREGSRFPLLVQLRDSELAPAVWAERNREQVEQWLREHGGLLFRGFDLPDPAAFEQFCQALCPQLYGQYGDLPKKEGGKNIYKSTPYPKDRMILFHNESAHQHRWPRRQWFYCEVPARVGGATPIVDSREVFRELPAWLQDNLRRKQLMYVRNFSRSLDVSWQHFFQTESRSEVERLCLDTGIQFHWQGADDLHTRQVCPAVILHPLTGEESFFNQIQLYHPAFLDDDIRQQFLRDGEAALPRQVFYGDGSELETAAIDAINAAYARCAVRFDWQQGDVVMLDNMLAAHARDPFEGERKIVVAMGEIYGRDQVTAAPAPAVQQLEESNP